SPAIAVAALIVAAAAAVIAFATRAGLQARGDLVSVLHLAGAEDGFIAALFQLRFGRMAAIAGLMGAGAAAIVAGLFRLIGGEAGLMPVLPIAWSDLLPLLACPLPADAVVALTGSSNARITAAMKLLEDGKATRMLVSGVNPEVSRADIKGVAKATRRYYDCCVDLGFQATDTVGNARETSGWMRAKGFKSLIVVTSDFHMPRAMLELHEALPDAKLTPYPVKTEDLDSGHWWRSGDGARRMIVEYCKYLVILAREA